MVKTRKKVVESCKAVHLDCILTFKVSLLTLLTYTTFLPTFTNLYKVIIIFIAFMSTNLVFYSFTPEKSKKIPICPLKNLL
jgi:hypothetical protein